METVSARRRVMTTHGVARVSRRAATRVCGENGEVDCWKDVGAVVVIDMVDVVLLMRAVVVFICARASCARRWRGKSREEIC